MYFVRTSLAAASAAIAFVAAGVAAQGYPERPLQLVVPFPAGAPVDALARAFGQALDRQLGQRVVVMNRDGASTTIAMNSLLAAPADGYTVVYGPVTALTVHVHWMKGLQFKPDSFTPLCQTFENVFFLAAGPNSPLKDWNAVIAAAKGKPGGVTYAQPGIASSPHLAGAELFQRAGVPATDVPFRGESAIVPQLREGGTDLAVVTTGLVEAQGLKPIVVFADQRQSAYPDTPTAAELGISVHPSGYGGLFVRADTPGPVMATLEQACKGAVADRSFQEVARRFHQQTEFLGRARFTARLNADARTKAELLKTVKLESQ
jgi:tripartite-type tricarboxylate transporter receptor subunit TctC